MVRIIGITGGIASGKSTVTEFLRQQGYQVIDADQVVHELQEPGPGSSWACSHPRAPKPSLSFGPAQGPNGSPKSRGTGWQARYAGRDGRHLFYGSSLAV